jgi:hypothetical protein
LPRPVNYALVRMCRRPARRLIRPKPNHRRRSAGGPWTRDRWHEAG